MTIHLPLWLAVPLLVAVPIAGYVLVQLGRVLELRRQTGDRGLSRWLR